MALTFGGTSTDKVAKTNAASIQTLAEKTLLVWVRPTSLLDGKYMYTKYQGGTNAGWGLYTHGTAGAVELDQQRATTDMIYISSTTPLVANTWTCLAATVSTAGNNGHIYAGSLTSSLTEVSYSTSTVGSGALQSDSSQDLVVGNNHPANGSFPGQIAIAILWNRILTLGEMRDQQFRPHPTSGCVQFLMLGWNGTSTQPDWSGAGNSGTCTGVALFAGGLPIAPQFFGDTRLSYVAAAGAGVTGSGALSISAPALAGAGTPTVTGSGGMSVAAPTLAGVGAPTVIGSGAITIGAPSISGTNSGGVTGSGGVTIAHPDILGSGISASAATRAAASDAAYGGASATDSEA